MISVSYAAAVFEDESRTILKVLQGPGKPIAVVVHSQANADGWNLAAKQVKTYCRAGLPVYYSVASAAKAIDRFLWYTARLGKSGASAR